ncbi:MAG: DEAD/DEAH box helicase [Acidimicrobiales bacterium]|nr:DEAD/DEAH box helicase [Acidimicrobiales bacterium]
MESTFGFTLDRFQREAIAALDRGESVLVAAPTGAGKTVVAEYATALALAHGRRAFYTTPIKALSNQKFRDLAQRFGNASVGLLTGDNSVNGDAPLVVMTTEVLRNMIYALSDGLDALEYVILDEVHYLQDAYRGPVWEEVIVHLPPQVRIVALSATVSNAEELAGWLSTVRGPTATVVERDRPIKLEHFYLVGEREERKIKLVPLFVGGKPNPKGSRYDVALWSPGRVRSRRRFYTPNRPEVVEVLRSRSMLPALYFIFSRAACDDAVRSCLAAGLRLTDRRRRSAIRRIVEDHLHGLSDQDLSVLGFQEWIAGLEAGIASHHAGLVPPFKEAVEACFVEGLIDVVFATETLALGINMPARSVVIEKLTKFTGEHHERLTPGQYTQLTGRAGRRGIDDHGNAVVLWSPWTTFDEVARLASSRRFRLQSAFRPTYNMAANLVRRYDADRAHHLLNLSFAQFQANRNVVRLESRLRQRQDELAELRSQATCERGDTEEYLRLLHAERTRNRERVAAAKASVQTGLRRLRPGEVISIGGQCAVVLSVSERRGGGTRLRLITSDQRVLNLGEADFSEPPRPIGEIELPLPFEPSRTAYQHIVADLLQSSGIRATGGESIDKGLPGRSRGAEVPEGSQVPPPRKARHAVDDCPRRDEHLRAARKIPRLVAEIAALERQIASQTGTLARSFDLILQLLESWGYLDGWALTSRGERLVRIFHECDLLIAESLEEGLFDDLGPAHLAGLISCFTYEHRSPEPPEAPWFPSHSVRHRFDRIARLASNLNDDERASGLPLTRPPDPTFFAVAYAWASGGDLEDVLEDEPVSGGDFVRNIKQLIDLLRQVAAAAPVANTAANARAAAEALFRGVVAASTAIDADDEAGAPG